MALYDDNGDDDDSEEYDDFVEATGRFKVSAFGILSKDSLKLIFVADSHQYCIWFIWNRW